jgi:hypothetical protein
MLTPQLLLIPIYSPGSRKVEVSALPKDTEKHNQRISRKIKGTAYLAKNYEKKI